MAIKQQATKTINLSDQNLTEGQTKLLKNTKSSIRYASSLPYTLHITRCRNLKESLFKVYLFYYKSDLMFQKLKE